MWKPSDCRREVLKRVWIDCYSQDAILVTNGQNSQRNEGRCPTTPADLEIIADMVDPATEPALKIPPTQVVQFIPGVFPGPNVYRIFYAERVAILEIARY